MSSSDEKGAGGRGPGPWEYIGDIARRVLDRPRVPADGREPEGADMHGGKPAGETPLTKASDASPS